MTANVSPPTVEWGQGPETLVLLHYFGGAALSWQWVAGALPHHRCVALNLPGFGGRPAPSAPSLATYADHVTDTLAGLQMDDYVLVGHSMGGKIALQVAIQSAQPPRRVVLVAPSPPTYEPMTPDARAHMLHGHRERSRAEAAVADATRQPLSVPQRALAVYTQTLVDDAVWRWWILEGMNHSIAPQLSRLQVPVTVLASVDDPVISFDTIRSEVMALLPGATLVTTRGAGHLLPLETAGWVAASLQNLG